MKPQKIVIRINPELEELIPFFLENRQKDILLITQSLEKNDYQAIERAAHIMKGAGGGYGFDRISEIGGSMESAAKEKNHQQIENSLNELKQFLERVEVIFE